MGPSPSPDDSFDAFFNAHFDGVFRTMWLLTQDREEAQDLAQETFARMLQHWDRLGHVVDKKAYAYRIAFNLRKRWRVNLLPWRDVEHTERLTEPDRRGEVEILEAVGRLPQSQREAVVLVAWLGFSADEAARLLRIRPSTVRVRLHRARSVLSEALDLS